MIKANELMLGSYIESDYGCNKPVIYCVDKLEDDCIRGRGVRCLDGSELDCPSSLYEYEEHFDPILITPEILVQLGFKKIFNDFFQLHINDKEFEYCIEEDDDCSFRLASSSCDFCLADDDCKYVHQIQKAMSLVGEELTMGDL